MTSGLTLPVVGQFGKLWRRYMTAVFPRTTVIERRYSKLTYYQPFQIISLLEAALSEAMFFKRRSRQKGKRMGF